MNSIILLLTFTVACSLAMPTNYGSISKSSTTSYAVPAVTILKQINELNDDGSYTFGYEASDGSFRLENMDANGYLTGRFGYVDSFGEMQEMEYVAGKLSGQSLGFQTRGSLIPIGRKFLPFPFIRTSPTKSVEQKALDYHNTIVNDVNRNTGGVQVVSPAKDSYNSGTTVVLVAADEQNSAAAVSDVRVSTPTKTTDGTTKSTDGLTDLVVHVVEKNQKTEDTYGKIADTQISHVLPVVVRVTNVAEADTPTIIQQKAEPTITNIQQLSEQVSIVRSPTTSYGKSPVKSTGKVDEFLKSLDTNTKNVGNYNTNEASGAMTQNQFQQDIQIQDAPQPIQSDSINVDSIGISSIA
ncbi:hypothetical protein DAPPUDRAFT_310585 [Daphnia pulex]|uniref:Uncharacterized protein n=1 Tax=Daphnia pulex TaxID=6669 RepID=E9FU33_DAPPU|nr:hypothetical protein DAPPUDRAFT_310585 [Daphnia pulex]|eukprot:EFX89474.1 hypothetical protein DAPPUDRAFT_310585 [Daphnia pulex]